MTHSELVLFPKQTFIEHPVMNWLLRDDAPSSGLMTRDAEVLEPLASIEFLKQQLCTSVSAYEKRQAALQLSRMGLGAVDALVYALLQECETCQVLAAYALRKMGCVVIKPLLAILDTCPTPARQKLIWVLYSIGDRQVIDTLILCLGDSDNKVRRYAAWGLGHFQDRRAIPGLVALLNDEVEKIRFDAAMALVKIGGTAVETLLEALYTADDFAQLQVIAVLSWLQDNVALDALQVALRDPKAGVRLRAAWALGWIGDARAARALLDTLNDSEGEVRMQAAVALGWIRDARAVNGFMKLHYDEDDTISYSDGHVVRELGGISN